MDTTPLADYLDTIRKAETTPNGTHETTTDKIFDTIESQRNSKEKNKNFTGEFQVYNELPEAIEYTVISAPHYIYQGNSNETSLVETVV